MGDTVLRFLVGGAMVASAALAQAAETVKVALNMPMSGAFANVGDLYVKSSQFAIEAINQQGGVLNGRKLEIVPFDNKNSPQEALLVLKQITDRHIQFMVQGGGSHIAVPLSEAVKKHNEREPSNRLLFLDEPGDQDLTNEKCSFWTFTFIPGLIELGEQPLPRHRLVQTRARELGKLRRLARHAPLP